MPRTAKLTGYEELVRKMNIPAAARPLPVAERRTRWMRSRWLSSPVKRVDRPVDPLVLVDEMGGRHQPHSQRHHS
jgi:hypothetical protein